MGGKHTSGGSRKPRKHSCGHQPAGRWKQSRRGNVPRAAPPPVDHVAAARSGDAPTTATRASSTAGQLHDILLGNVPAGSTVKDVATALKRRGIISYRGITVKTPRTVTRKAHVVSFTSDSGFNLRGTRTAILTTIAFVAFDTVADMTFALAQLAAGGKAFTINHAIVSVQKARRTRRRTRSATVLPAASALPAAASVNILETGDWPALGHVVAAAPVPPAPLAVVAPAPKRRRRRRRTTLRSRELANLWYAFAHAALGVQQGTGTGTTSVTEEEIRKPRVILRSVKDAGMMSPNRTPTSTWTSFKSVCTHVLWKKVCRFAARTIQLSSFTTTATMSARRRAAAAAA